VSWSRRSGIAPTVPAEAVKSLGTLLLSSHIDRLVAAFSLLAQAMRELR